MNDVVHDNMEEYYQEEKDEYTFLKQLEEEELANSLAEETTQAVLFRRDGDYGWVEFAGLFKNIDMIIQCLSEPNKDIAISETTEEVKKENPHLDFMVVNLHPEVPEELFGVRLVKENSITNLY